MRPSNEPVTISAYGRNVEGNIYFGIGTRLGCVYGCGDGLDMET